jgi:hypothetical protein
VPVEQVGICDNSVKQGKIVLIDGVLESIYRFGFHLWRPEQFMFAVDFWISTKNIDSLDENRITKENMDIYLLVTEKITSVVSKDILLIGAIGSELIFSHEGDLESIVNNSKNVCEWIFTEEKFYSCFDKFSKFKINGFTVYWLKD